MKTSVESSDRSCSADRSGAPSRVARRGLARAEASRLRRQASVLACRASSILAACSPWRISCASDRVRGENPCVPTCSDSSRFVLPAPFAPGHEDEARLEGQLEPGVRPEVAKRDRRDDQPASLIGMIRYQNESSADVIRPARSGLISFMRTVSPRTDSTPSARNSALKPISSGSPVYAGRQRLAASRRRPGSAPRWSARPRRSGAGEARCGAPSRRRAERRRAARRAEGRPRSRTTPAAARLTSGNWPSMRRVVSHVSPVPKTTVFSLHAELDRLGAGGDPGQLRERARRNDRLELRPVGLELGLLERQAVGVGRGHEELLRPRIAPGCP